MHVRSYIRTLLGLAGVYALTACNPAPSRSEALEALRAAAPGIDTTTVFARVWQDGPPWFSCAEVLAKFTSRIDSAVVRDLLPSPGPKTLNPARLAVDLNFSKPAGKSGCWK